jgi:hypothetical protein
MAASIETFCKRQVMKGKRGTAMKKSLAIFRGAFAVAALALTFTTLQILFDVPVLPFLVPAGGAASAEITAAYEGGGAQKAEGDVTLAAYPSIIVQRGMPVAFTLNAAADQIDDCNEYLSFPDFGLNNVRLVPGANVIRFTPEESGVFYFHCHLNNMRSTVTVVENLGFVMADNESPTPVAGMRGMSGTWRAQTPAPSEPLETEPVPLESSVAEAPEAEPSAAAPSESEPALQEPLEPTAAPRSPGPSPSETSAPAYEKPDDVVEDIGGWLERQLTPSTGAEGVHEILSWTGWIFDRDCVGISPVKHTKACNLMGGCYDSGLGVFEHVPGKEFDTYTAVETFLCFDGASKELAREFLRALPTEWKNNVTVTVTGYAVNNIPAAKDELLVPETDLARVDHYLSGIHVTSITTAFIDGVSTNPPPEPNISFSQP